MEPQPTARLSNGYTIPLVGLGTWKAAKGEVQQAVLSALRAGYRHIDCASVYANEHEVIKKGCCKIVTYYSIWVPASKSAGNVEALGIMISYRPQRQQANDDCRSEQPCKRNSDHAPARVEPAVRKTLSDLQLDYLDAYLIHFPSSMPGPVIRPSLLDVWRAMEALVDKVGACLESAIQVSALQDYQWSPDGGSFHPFLNARCPTASTDTYHFWVPL
eukprot:scaffold256462_cov18-Tisochrysis_lutea.AAC.1